MKEQLLAILDKNINQEQLGKDIAMAFVVPKLEELKAKVLAKEVDLIKGTSLDNEAVAKVIEQMIAKVSE